MSEEAGPPRLVLFDLDDTLCDYAGARRERLRIAFSGPDGGDNAARFGFDLERMIADSIERHPHGADHFPRLFADHGIDDPAAARAAAAWYRANPFHALALHPHAADVVAEVRRLGGRTPTPVGVVTNGPAEVQRAKARLLGIEDLVDFVVISGEFGAAKPEPAIFAEALRLGGATPDEAIMIGDSLEFDVAGARASGIASVWIDPSGAPPPALVRPDHTLRDLAETPALLRALGVGAGAALAGREGPSRRAR